MSEIYHQYSTMYLFEGDRDLQPPQLISFLPTTPIFCSSQPRGYSLVDRQHDHQQPQASECYSKPADGSNGANDGFTKKFVYDSTRSASSNGWVSSKIRLMKKMINSDLRHGQHHPNSNNNNLSNGGLRVCSACNTTKTPLWRSGPQGPKSLCNACGIRQRKARKAMAAAAAINSETTIATEPRREAKEIKSSQKTQIPVMPFKKRCKFTTPHDHKGFIDDLSLGLSLGQQNPGLHPQEKEAAILLMAMSCDVICSR